MLHLSRRAQCAGARCTHSRPRRFLLASLRATKKTPATAGDYENDAAPRDEAATSTTPPNADDTDAPLIRSTRAPRRKTTTSTPTTRGSAASRARRAAEEEAARFAAAAASSDPAIAALRGRLVKRTPPALVRSQGLPAATLDVGVLGAGQERYYAISVVEGKEERYASWLLKRARSGQAPGGVPAPPAPTIAEVWAPKRSALVYVPSTDSLSKTTKPMPYAGGGWVFVRCVMDAAAAAAIAATPHFAAWRGAQRWDAGLLRAAGALDYYASVADEKAGKLSPPPSDLRVEGGGAGSESGAVVLPVPSGDALVSAVRAWEAEADPSRGGAVLAEEIEARRREVYGDAGGTIFGVTDAEARAAAEAQKAAARSAGRGAGAGGRGAGGRAGRGAGVAAGRGGRQQRGQADGYYDRYGDDQQGGGARWSSDDGSSSSNNNNMRTPPSDARGGVRRTLGDGARFDPYSLDRDMASDRYTDERVGRGDYDTTPSYRGRHDETFEAGGGGAGREQGRGAQRQRGGDFDDADGSDDVIGDALYMGDELFASDSRMGRYGDEEQQRPPRNEQAPPPSLPTPPGDRGRGARRGLGDGARFDPYSLDRDTASDRYSSDDDEDRGGGGYYDDGGRQQQQQQQRQPSAAAANKRSSSGSKAAASSGGAGGNDPLGDTLFGGRAHAEDGGRYFDDDDDGGGGGGAWYDGGGEDPGAAPAMHAGAWFAEGTVDEDDPGFGGGGGRGGGASASASGSGSRAANGGAAAAGGGRRGGGKSKVVPGSDAVGDALFGLDYVEGGYRGVDLED
jgi:hypothetical protein